MQDVGNNKRSCMVRKSGPTNMGDTKTRTIADLNLFRTVVRFSILQLLDVRSRVVRRASVEVPFTVVAEDGVGAGGTGDRRACCSVGLRLRRGRGK